jgi:hypothetical protein
LKKTKSKRYFTLLEILVCLALITTLSALFGFQGKRLLEKQRIENSLQLLKGEKEKAKFLSLVYQADIDLEIICEKKGLFLQRNCDEPGLASNKRLSLPGLKDLRYQGQKRKKIVFAKFSSGHVIEELSLEFRTNEDIWRGLLCSLQAQLSDTEKKSLKSIPVMEKS